MRQSLTVMFLLLGTLAIAQSPPWTGILDTTRATDWSHAGVWNSPPLTGGGIPHRTILCTLTSPVIATNNVIYPSGEQDVTDAMNINAAMQQCAAQASASNPLVLQLGAGTFYIQGGISFGTAGNGFAVANYITLRGMGPDQTKLISTTTGSVCSPIANTICLMGSIDGAGSTTYPPVGSCSWTDGYTAGSTILTLGDCMTGQAGTGFTTAAQNGVASQPDGAPNVGFHITLDQRNDDIGVQSCSSVGSLATCIVGGPLPSTFVANGTTCVGLNATMNSGFTDGYTTGTAPNQVTYSNYNVPILTPNTYSGPGSQHCAAVITAVNTGNPPTTPATFSYNLPYSSNLPTWYCGTDPRPTYTSVPYGTNPANVGGSGANGLGAVYPCYATVDTGGTYVTSVVTITGTGNGNGSLGGGATLGRSCPDGFYNGSTAARPWSPGCMGSSTSAANEIGLRSNAIMKTVTAVCTGAGTGNTAAGNNVAVAGCQNANQIQIDSPITGNIWRHEQSPGIFWYRGYLHDDGVEDLSIDGTNDGGAQTNATIVVIHCYNCWFRNLRTMYGSRNHIWLNAGNQHITVRDSYFWGTKRGSNQSYAPEMYYTSSDVLVENNIMDHIVSALMNGGANGSVESYNYEIDDGYGQTPLFLMKMESLNHDFNGFNLIEANNTPGVNYDNIHGAPTGSITEFRERIRGLNIPRKNNNLYPVFVDSFNRAVNFVGNVVGTSPLAGSVGIANNGSVTYSAFFQNNCASIRAVWCGAYTAAAPAVPADSLVLSTMIRWGNWQPVLPGNVTPGGTLWCATGNETGCNNTIEWPQGSFVNIPAISPPANHNLPPSFYLPSQPQWFVTPWGTPAWPPIGPDVNNGDNVPANCIAIYFNCGDDPSGHSNKIPSQVVYENAPIDIGYMDPRNVVTGATWALSTPGVPVFGTLSAVTLTGTFYIYFNDTYRLQGASPAGYNYVYLALYTNGPQPTYVSGTGERCGGSTVCAALPSPANSLPSGSWNFKLTRVIGSTQGHETTTSAAAGISTDTGCPAPSGGTLNCTIRVLSPNCDNAGYNATPCGTPVDGPTYAGYYNVYASIGGTAAATTRGGGIYCRQNVNPVPVGTDFYMTAFIAPFISPDGGTTWNPNPACFQPPVRSTAPATQVISFMPFNPAGDSSTSNTATTPGTVIFPYVKVFNADNYYGTGEIPPPPPTPSANCAALTGSATLSGSAALNCASTTRRR